MDYVLVASSPIYDEIMVARTVTVAQDFAHWLNIHFPLANADGGVESNHGGSQTVVVTCDDNFHDQALLFWNSFLFRRCAANQDLGAFSGEVTPSESAMPVEFMEEIDVFFY